jgi:hypothetical protein
VALSPRELALTELLMQKAGRVVTKDSIVARLSSWESDFSENSVEVYVHRLRKRFAELGVVIKTVRGFGYVLEPAEGGAAGAQELVRWPHRHHTAPAWRGGCCCRWPGSGLSA